MGRHGQSAAVRGRALRRFLGVGALVAAMIVLLAVLVPSALAADPPQIGADISGGINLGNWPKGSTVHVVVDADNNPGNGTLTSFDVEIGNEDWKYTDREQFGNVDLQAGMYVRATQGATSVTLHLLPIAVTEVDPVTNIIRGTASPSAPVRVAVWPQGDGDDWAREVTAGSDGHWQADFTGLHDIVRGDEGGASRYDENGNWTQASWRVPRCRIAAGISSSIELQEWAAGSPVHVTIDADSDPGNGSLFSGDFEVDGWGNTWVDADRMGGVNLQPGQYVMATQGSNSSTLQLAPIAVTNVDVAANTVHGTSDPGVTVHVEVWQTEDDVFKDATAGPAGGWVASFAGVWNLVAGSEGRASRYDAEGDSTFVMWRVPNPRIHVDPVNDNIGLEEWTVGTTVTVTVDNDSIPGNGVLMSRVFGPIDPEGWSGEDVDTDLKPGQYVTATQGATTKTLVVAAMGVTAADAAADTVSGFAPAGSQVEVWIDDVNAGTNVNAGSGGAWTARFRGEHNLVAGERGQAAVADADGDQTQTTWAATSVTIKRNLSKVKRGKVIAFSGVGKPGDLAGQLIRVQVRKPGKKAWTTIALRVATRSGSSAIWSCRYRIPKGSALGSYSFRAVYLKSGAYDADRYSLMGCTSPTVKAVVTR